VGHLAQNDFFRLFIGFSSVCLAFFSLLYFFSEPVIFIASIYFIATCSWDSVRAKIPNFLNASLAIAGLALFFYNDGWAGLVTGTGGLILGLCLLIIPWLMGGMGAGDVKALAALGALLGPSQLIHVFIYMGLIGGVMAVLHYAFERNLVAKTSGWFHTLMASALTKDPRLLVPETTEVSRFPYAAAIAFGYYSYLAFGKVF